MKHALTLPAEPFGLALVLSMLGALVGALVIAGVLAWDWWTRD
ncbi:hypothetical protein ABT095_15780 [Kitasatospora sp. NPDC002227]